MSVIEMERRISEIESEFSARLAKLEEQVSRLSPQPETAWWKKIVGVYKDDPEFDEAMRLGREYRESLRPSEEDEAP